MVEILMSAIMAKEKNQYICQIENLEKPSKEDRLAFVLAEIGKNSADDISVPVEEDEKWIKKSFVENDYLTNFTAYIFSNIWQYLVWHGTTKTRLQYNSKENDFYLYTQKLSDFITAEVLKQEPEAYKTIFKQNKPYMYANEFLIGNRDFNPQNWGVKLFEEDDGQKAYIYSRIDFSGSGIYKETRRICRSFSQKCEREMVVSSFFDLCYQLSTPSFGYDVKDIQEVMLSKEFANQLRELAIVDLDHIKQIAQSSILKFEEMFSKITDEVGVAKIKAVTFYQAISRGMFGSCSSFEHGEMLANRMVTAFEQQIKKAGLWADMIEITLAPGFKGVDIYRALENSLSHKVGDSVLKDIFTKLYNITKRNLALTKEGEGDFSFSLCGAGAAIAPSFGIKFPPLPPSAPSSDGEESDDEENDGSLCRADAATALLAALALSETEAKHGRPLSLPCGNKEGEARVEMRPLSAPCSTKEKMGRIENTLGWSREYIKYVVDDDRALAFFPRPRDRVARTSTGSGHEVSFVEKLKAESGVEVEGRG